MRKFTILSGLLLGAMSLPATAMAADGFMEPATLVSPTSLNVSMAPFSVDITWDNQPIELVDPYFNDWEEEVVDVYVTLGDGEPQTVTGAILSSVGWDDEEDVWDLEVALYELDEIFDFTGHKITVSIPEGVVKNGQGLLNPAQEFVFNIVDTYTNYTLSPESGSTLTSPDAYVTISYNGIKPEYVSGEVVLYVYEPTYKTYGLAYGEEVTVNEKNEVVINLNSLPSGEYEMLIPEGMFSLTVDGAYYINSDLWLEYTLDTSTGITEISSERMNGTVFNLNGVKVGDTLNGGNLSPGIYVTGGKKIIIRK